MTTAHEAFRVMLRDHVAPALRRLGFKGSGQSFALRSDTHWALLGFQLFRDRHATSVKFTVNLTVVPREIWTVWRQASPSLPTSPHANVSYGPGVRWLSAEVRAGYWWQRIGALMPVRNGHWWELGADADITTVAAEVLDAIETYALPEMRRRLDNDRHPT